MYWNHMHAWEIWEMQTTTTTTTTTTTNNNNNNLKFWREEITWNIWVDTIKWTSNK
jgi:hypothetical protein